MYFIPAYVVDISLYSLVALVFLLVLVTWLWIYGTLAVLSSESRFHKVYKRAKLTMTLLLVINIGIAMLVIMHSKYVNI